MYEKEIATFLYSSYWDTEQTSGIKLHSRGGKSLHTLRQRRLSLRSF